MSTTATTLIASMAIVAQAAEPSPWATGPTEADPNNRMLIGVRSCSVETPQQALDFVNSVSDRDGRGYNPMVVYPFTSGWVWEIRFENGERALYRYSEGILCVMMTAYSSQDEE